MILAAVSITRHMMCDLCLGVNELWSRGFEREFSLCSLLPSFGYGTILNEVYFWSLIIMNWCKHTLNTSNSVTFTLQKTLFYYYMKQEYSHHLFLIKKTFLSFWQHIWHLVIKDQEDTFTVLWQEKGCWYLDLWWIVTGPRNTTGCLGCVLFLLIHSIDLSLTWFAFYK